MKKGTITISRSQASYISICVQDNDSREILIDGKMELADFAAVVTGHGFMPIAYETGNLNRIGKLRETELATVKVDKSLLAEIPKIKPGQYGMPRLQQYLLRHCQRPGWEIDTYLGSQDSVSGSSDEPTLRFRYFRYVEKT